MRLFLYDFTGTAKSVCSNDSARNPNMELLMSLPKLYIWYRVPEIRVFGPHSPHPPAEGVCPTAGGPELL
jgi:hypothetical protein